MELLFSNHLYPLLIILFISGILYTILFIAIRLDKRKKEINQIKHSSDYQTEKALDLLNEIEVSKDENPSIAKNRLTSDMFDSGEASQNVRRYAIG